MTADRNLLLGILALESKLLSREVLIQAIKAWAGAKGRPLGEVLIAQGSLAPEQLARLDALVEEHLAQHDSNATRSLAAVAATIPTEIDLATVTGAEHALRGGADSEPTLAPATRNGSRFVIVRPHAKGGLGEVFVARDAELNRDVALKEIQARHAADPNSRARFVQEAEITGSLEHPSIVPVYGFGLYADGRPFYAMRFIQGESLMTAIQAFHGTRRADAGERNLELRKLLGAFLAVCQAIRYAHSRGIVHRDLKPENVMLGKFGETLVVDWGLAKPLEPGPGNPELLGPKTEAPLQPTTNGRSVETQAGTALGTPAYMSPEQAAGEAARVGPASDIYSLGATLYVVLTGKPPFAGSVPRILSQVRKGMFPRPRQESAHTPAALEAICLKAMALRPQDRYATVLELAEDVEHWLADEPVHAWTEPLSVRLGRWVRRHKSLVSAATAALLVGLIALGAGLIFHQRELDRQSLALARSEQEVSRALRQARDSYQELSDKLKEPGGVFQLLNNPADWKGGLRAAGAALESAAALAGNTEGMMAGPLGLDLEELEQCLQIADVDQRLALELDQVRQGTTGLVKERFDYAGTMQAYEQVFQRAGYDVRTGPATEVAKRISQASIREQLLAALDDWALAAWHVGKEGAVLQLIEQVLEVARRADPDELHDRLRDAKLWADRRALETLAGTLSRELASEQPGRKLSPQMAFLVGNLLRNAGADAERWLRQAQAAHAADFWLNFELAYLLQEKKQEEAIGFYRVALAHRPQSGAAHNNLGNALRDKRDLDGAIRHFHRALAIDPNHAAANNNLGTTLRDKKDLDGAVKYLKRAVELDPNYMQAHINLADTLQARNDLDGAREHYQKALEIDPHNPKAHFSLGLSLHVCGDLDGAMQCYRKALEIRPNYALAHGNLAIALAARNDLPAAIPHMQKVVELEPRRAMGHSNLGLMLYYADRIDEAFVHCEKALELEPNYAEAHVNLGLILKDRGDPEGAIQHYRKAVQLNPNLAEAHVNLGGCLIDKKELEAGMEHCRQALRLNPNLAAAHANLGQRLRDLGQFAEALDHLRRAQQLGSQHPGQAEPYAQWVEECAQLLSLDQKLAQVSAGKAQPGSPRDQLEFARLCMRYKKQHASAVQFFADAFARQPDLVEEAPYVHRFEATRAAALAASGQGSNAKEPDARDKAQLRRQALDWLNADLQLFRNKVGTAAKPEEIIAVVDRLTAWQTETDLAAFRAGEELARLPTIEQTAFLQLWSAGKDLLRQARSRYQETQQPGSLTALLRRQLHPIQLAPAATCVIDVESRQFDPSLRLEDAQGKRLAGNGGIQTKMEQNTRVIFTPRQGGLYRLVVTSMKSAGTGAYVLRIREFPATGVQKTGGIRDSK